MNEAKTTYTISRPGAVLGGARALGRGLLRWLPSQRGGWLSAEGLACWLDWRVGAELERVQRAPVGSLYGNEVRMPSLPPLCGWTDVSVASTPEAPLGPPPPPVPPKPARKPRKAMATASDTAASRRVSRGRAASAAAGSGASA